MKFDFKFIITAIIICILNGCTSQDKQNEETAVNSEITPFKDGDKVAFVGDSITDGGHYHSLIWLYYMTHFPELKLWIGNYGISGDTAWNILDRIEGDVFANKPNVVALTFGMNDTSYYGYDREGAKEYADSCVNSSAEAFAKIIEKCHQHPECKYIMIGSSPYDETADLEVEGLFYRITEKNAAMKRIIEMQKDSAAVNNWEFVDFNEPMIHYASKAQEKDKSYSFTQGDRIHPDNEGHALMAYIFLKAQGLIGKPVADITINANNGNVELQENCSISDLKNNSNELSFNYLSKSLPFPLDTFSRGWGPKRCAADILKYFPEFLDSISLERLTIKDLVGNYKLTIDNIILDTLSSENLAKGINLAKYPQTPQHRQAEAVAALNELRWDIERSFRDFAWIQFNFFPPVGISSSTPDSPEAIDTFHKRCNENIWAKVKDNLYDRMCHPEVREATSAEMHLLVDKIYSINKPKTHKIKLEKL